MFKIIGGDQQEYGPVSEEELREWIRSGRAARDSLAQAVGESEWKPLSSFPEFADALGDAGIGGPAHPPSTGPNATGESGMSPRVDPQTLADAARARNTTVDIGGAFGRAWNILTGDLWPIVGVSALVIVTMAAASSAAVGPLISGPLMGGLFGYLLRKIRRQTAGVSEAFAGFGTPFLQLFLGGLVAGLLTGVGLVLCLLPGIYLAVVWSFSLPLILDRKLDFWDAMEVSRKVIQQRWWGFFGFLCLSWLINFVGLLACGVGVFITFPWTMLALACLYEDRFGKTSPLAS